MVNYCCVSGCNRNNKTSKHLFFYGLPKEQARLNLWIQAIKREDLLEKNVKKIRAYRVCSRHFSPSSIKNRHLCADAVPSLYLPNTKDQEEEQEEEEKCTVHNDIICNSCKKPILGFRYKCITCPDYDLCSKCEMFEAHSDHYLLRIPKPVDFKVADDLIQKWQEFVNIEHINLDFSENTDDSSDDNMPIKKITKQNDSGINLSEDMKAKIRNEVSRILSIKQQPKKRKKEIKKKDPKRKKKMAAEDKTCKKIELELEVPEVAFADVNEFRPGQVLDVKFVMPPIITPTLGSEQSMVDLTLTDDDFMLAPLG